MRHCLAIIVIINVLFSMPSHASAAPGIESELAWLDRLTLALGPQFMGSARSGLQSTFEQAFFANTSDQALQQALTSYLEQLRALQIEIAAIKLKKSFWEFSILELRRIYGSQISRQQIESELEKSGVLSPERLTEFFSMSEISDDAFDATGANATLVATLISAIRTQSSMEARLQEIAPQGLQSLREFSTKNETLLSELMTRESEANLSRFSLIWSTVFLESQLDQNISVLDRRVFDLYLGRK